MIAERVHQQARPSGSPARTSQDAPAGRRFLVLHGVDNWRPTEHWQWWLTDELRGRGEHVLYPQLPSPSAPVLEDWLAVLRGELGQMGDGERVVIAHSASVALWLLAAPTLSPDLRVDRVVLVAPPAPSILRDGYPGVAPVGLDWAAVATASKAGVIVVSSDRDPDYPEGVEACRAFYVEPLGLEHHIIPGAGHLSIGEGFGPWPEMLDWCLTGKTAWRHR